MAYVSVDVDVSEFEDSELIEELKFRGYEVFDDTGAHKEEDLEKIWLLRRTGQAYDHLMDEYIYKVLGKVI